MPGAADVGVSERNAWAFRRFVARRDWRDIVVHDTTKIDFVGREQGRHGLGLADDIVSPVSIRHPIVGLESATEAVLSKLDAHAWTRSDDVNKMPACEPGIAEKKSEYRLDCLALGRRGLLVRAGQGPAFADASRLFATPRHLANFDLLDSGPHANAAPDSGTLSRI